MPPLTLLRHATQKPPTGPLQRDPGSTLAVGLEGFWVINETDGRVLNDISGRGRTIIPFNSLALTGWTSTREGAAVQGNAANVVWWYQNASAIYAGSAVTLWVRAITVTNGSFQHLIGVRYGSSVADLYILHLSSSASFEARYRGSNGTNVDVTITPAAQGLHTLALDFNGSSTVTGWLDGVSVGSGGGASTTTVTDAGLYLFRSEEASPNPGSETIIACALWTRTLTAGEHRQLHAEPYAIFQSRPLQRWSALAGGGAAGPQDTPELYGRPRLAHRQMQQLLAQ